MFLLIACAILLTSRSLKGTCISSSARLSAYLWLIASYSSLAVAVTCKELSFQRIAYVSAYESVLPSMRSNVGASRHEILEVRPVAAHECDCIHDMRLLSVDFTYTIPRECRSASLVMPNGKGSSRGKAFAMIRPIMRNELVLQQPSTAATEADLPIAQDLLDTLAAHRHSCVAWRRT